MQVEPTLDLLTQIHQGSHMAVQGYDEVLKDTQDEQMRQMLAQLQDEHKEVALEASRRLMEHGAIPKEPPMMTRLIAWAQEGLQTMFDGTPDRLMSILLDGARMGLVATENSIDRDFHADPDVLEFALRYRDQQRCQLDQLRELRRQVH